MFKIGDKVRCVAHDAGGLAYGAEYTVANVNEEFVYVIREEGYSGGYYPYRFELVTEEKPKGYVWRDYADVLHLQAYLSSVPDDATCVWELGEELVKRVTWEKKDA